MANKTMCLFACTYHSDGCAVVLDASLVGLEIPIVCENWFDAMNARARYQESRKYMSPAALMHPVAWAWFFHCARGQI